MNTIAAENYKLFKDKSFKILLLSGSLCFFLLSLIFKVLSQMPDAPSGLSGASAPYNTTITVTFFLIFCGIIAGTYIASDFERGTIRNALSTGTNRTAYYLSKLYTLFLSCTIITLFLTTIYTLSMTVFLGWNGSTSAHYFLNLLVFYVVLLVQMFSYCSLFVMTALLLRNVGGVIAITLIYVTMLETLISSVMGMTEIPLLTTIALNMPRNVITGLPQFVSNDTIMTIDFVSTTIPALIIIIVSTAVGIIVFNKRDIK